MGRKNRVGRNDKCPCGSGKKYKKCCLGTGRRDAPISAHSRAIAQERLVELSMSVELDEEQDLAWAEFMDEAPPVNHEAMEPHGPNIDACFDDWFFFDRELPDGTLLVDQVLADRSLDAGAATWLRRMRATTMRPYEVVEVRPGRSLSLLGPDGTTVEVRERSASRTLTVGMAIAARIISQGASGHPEVEGGALHLPRLLRRRLDDQLTQWREAEHDLTDHEFWKLTPPFFYAAFCEAMAGLSMPRLQNTDGEEMTLTRARFSVRDAAAVRAGIARDEAFVPLDNVHWSWHHPDRDVVLGRLDLDGDRLVLECNSVERGERGRARLEALLGDAASHVVTEHESMERRLRQARAEHLGESLESELPFEVQERVFHEYQERHYRDWLDIGVPALDGLTPRDAARQPAMKARLASLLRGLDEIYADCLRQGRPAWDPSWMWEELGLRDASSPHPPPLAHERLYEAHDELGRAAQQVANRARDRAGFDVRTSLCTPGDLEEVFDAARLARQPEVAPLIPWLADFELHRRKVLWVDRTLAWQLAASELELEEAELRLPFPSFALVFTDARTMSLAERWLARERPASPLVGYRAVAVTLYITADEPVRICLDAGGEDPPEVLEHALSEAPEGPLARLFHVARGAILHATLPSAQRVDRAPPTPGRRRTSGEDPDGPRWSSDQVVFLPGTIDISRVRQLEALERAPGGRELLQRFLVRGHWRRPNPSWHDQSMRWIEPYWKGPDLAPTIEKAYRLVP